MFRHLTTASLFGLSAWVLSHVAPAFAEDLPSQAVSGHFVSDTWGGAELPVAPARGAPVGGADAGRAESAAERLAAIPLDAKAKALELHPELGPLLQCYDLTYHRTLRAIADHTGEETKYVARILVSGGIVAIGATTQQVCDEWYLEQTSILGDKVSNIALMGAGFQNYYRKDERAFVDRCLEQEGNAAWEALIPLCRKLLP